MLLVLLAPLSSSVAPEKHSIVMAREPARAGVAQPKLTQAQLEAALGPGQIRLLVIDGLSLDQILEWRIGPVALTAGRVSDNYWYHKPIVTRMAIDLEMPWGIHRDRPTVARAASPSSISFCLAESAINPQMCGGGNGLIVGREPYGRLQANRHGPGAACVAPPHPGPLPRLVRHGRDRGSPGGGGEGIEITMERGGSSIDVLSAVARIIIPVTKSHPWSGAPSAPLSPRCPGIREFPHDGPGGGRGDGVRGAGRGTSA